MIKGLSTSEVQVKYQNGQRHVVDDQAVRPIKTIVIEHVFTLFNLVNLVLASLVFMVGAYANATFMLIVVFNTMIGIAQSLKARHMLSQLNVTSQLQVDVIRDGKQQSIGLNDLVLDDCLVLKAGMQLPVDGYLIDGQVEVDEAMLTGESLLQTKHCKDEMLSGSVVMSGSALMHVNKVGANTYMHQYMKEAKSFKLASSVLKQVTKKIIKTVIWVMFPLGVLLFITRLFLVQASLEEAILTSVAGMIGMMPEGLVLLISISLMLGALKMASKKALVQELPAIEMLARTDIICCDKTGTITTGKMMVTDVLTTSNKAFIDQLLTTFAYTLPSDNATQLALKKAYEKTGLLMIDGYVDFSSKRKWSAIIIANKTYVLGAFDYLLKEEDLLKAQNQANQGKRVLALVEVDHVLTGEDVVLDAKYLALVCLNEEIRTDAAQTFAFFKQQQVTIKVISGDHPSTLSKIGETINITNTRALDASLIDFSLQPELLQDYDLFGRVAPEQKAQMIKLMEQEGHVVAMIGDGVNDVLALKQASCSIAMANGSDASRLVAQMVLLDSRFASLKQVLKEGRRVINNIERVASLYLVKIIYTILLVSFFTLTLRPYPYVPIQLTLMNALTIGIPSFVFAVMPNGAKVKPHFAYRLLRNVLPGGLMIAVVVIGSYWLSSKLKLSLTDARSFAVFITGIVQFQFLIFINQPLTKFKALMYIPLISLFALAFFSPPLSTFFKLTIPTMPVFILSAILALGAWIGMYTIQKGMDYVVMKRGMMK